MKNFKINIGGIKRSYPIISLNKDVKGVYFFLPGDVKLIEKCAEIFFDIINGLDFDIIVTAEAGGIPLAHSLARLTSKNYLVLRKNVKPYMDNPIKEKIKSITTPGVQNIVIDYRDISKVQDKTIVILDDIISTGGTIATAANILRDGGAERVFAACTHGLFIEDAANRLRVCDDILSSDTLEGVYTRFSVAPAIADAL